MAGVKKGDRVCIHYRGTFEDGTEFDSSFERKPVDIVLGEGEVVPGFENAIIGMKKDERKTVTLTPAEAYGERRKDLVVEMDRARLPAEKAPKVGQRLRIKSKGRINIVTVVEVKKDSLVLDGNPPLAGKTLVFDIKLVETY
ncbi:MAG: peptidylprolyl isomerase [Pirellulales bacterium]|nr:peptidylprolyl isomerase [Pirellulales bacterium]